MSLELLTVIPILLRITTNLMRVLSGTSTASDIVTIVDAVVELVRRNPVVARYLDMLQPWIEKLKAAIPVFHSNPAEAQKLGLVAANGAAAEAIVQLHTDLMQRLIAEGLAAQDAIQSDDDVLGNV